MGSCPLVVLRMMMMMMAEEVVSLAEMMVHLTDPETKNLSYLYLKISITLNYFLYNFYTIKKSNCTSSLWIKACVSRNKLSANWSLILGSLCTDWSTLIWTSTEPLLCERGNKLL